MQQPTTPHVRGRSAEASPGLEDSRTFGEQYPDLFESLQSLRTAVDNHGPLPEKVRRLITLAFAISKGLHSSIAAETAKALKAGVSDEEIQQVALMTMTELGFSHTMNALGVINPGTGRGALR